MGVYGAPRGYGEACLKGLATLIGRVLKGMVHHAAVLVRLILPHILNLHSAIRTTRPAAPPHLLQSYRHTAALFDHHGDDAEVAA